MTKAEKEARTAILNYCKRNKIEICSIRHMHPRSYVVGYAASACLIIALPWMDSESHLKEHDRKFPLATVHHFDETLKAGDWCYAAYVTTPTWRSEIAVRISGDRR